MWRSVGTVLKRCRKISAHFGRLPRTDHRFDSFAAHHLSLRSRWLDADAIPTRRLDVVGLLLALPPERGDVGARHRSGRDANDVSVTAEVEIQPRVLRSWTSKGWSRNGSAERINVRLLCET